MSQIINTNIASINAQRNLDRSQGENQTALERLSSGLRINSASDDAAGLAISTRFSSQTQGLGVGIRNANDGVSLAQTAEGALGSMTDNLQRVRELALQSANATNSPQDRESLNQEVQELKAEISRVSEQTNFNGTKLLDGSFAESVFQIGANRGETVGVDIAGTTPDQLGASQTDGLTSFPSAQGDSDKDMAGGDLVINGISIDAPDAADDPDSFKDAGQSAIARAAAVNAKSDDSGVKAVVNETSVSGSTIETDDPLPVNDDSEDPVVMELNGTEIKMPSGTDGQSAGAFLDSVVSTINEKTDQTKVEASFSGDPRAGIKLTAPDGENITIDFSSNTNGQATNSDGSGDIDTEEMAASYGLADTDPNDDGDESRTFRGTYTLISEDGSDIDLSTSGDISRAGFQVGKFSGNNSGTVSSIVGSDPLKGDDLTINGTTIGSSRAEDDTGSPEVTDPASSAIAKAEAINRSSDSTGVTAEATPTVLTSENIDDGDIGGGDADFKINGEDVSLSFDGSETATEAQQKVVNAVNDAGITGVTAESFSTSDGRSFRLVAEDGRNISVTDFNNANTNPSALGLDGSATEEIDDDDAGQVQRASVSLESAGSIEIGTLSGDTDSSGFEVGTFGANESGQLLRDVDISTVEGANDAITSMDNALDQVNRQRADLGAIQNRFESTIENQEVASENLEAANSRIRDADFAEESAELSRTQVLQQAGLSILGQANQQPQQVLQLLQG